MTLLRFRKLVTQHFHLAAQTRGIRFQQLDLVEELDQPLRLQLRLERRETILELLLQLRQALVGGFDALARFFVIEQGRPRRRGEKRQRNERCV